MILELDAVLVCDMSAVSCLEAVIENGWNLLGQEFHTLCIMWPTDLSNTILGNNLSLQAYLLPYPQYYKSCIIIDYNRLTGDLNSYPYLIHLVSQSETVGNAWFIWFQSSYLARVIVCNHQFLMFLMFCMILLVPGLRLKTWRFRTRQYLSVELKFCIWRWTLISHMKWMSLHKILKL